MRPGAVSGVATVVSTDPDTAAERDGQPFDESSECHIEVDSSRTHDSHLACILGIDPPAIGSSVRAQPVLAARNAPGIVSVFARRRGRSFLTFLDCCCGCGDWRLDAPPLSRWTSFPPEPGQSPQATPCQRKRYSKSRRISPARLLRVENHFAGAGEPDWLRSACCDEVSVRPRVRPSPRRVSRRVRTRWPRAVPTRRTGVPSSRRWSCY